MNKEQLAEWMKKEHAKVAELAGHLREQAVTIPSGSRVDWLKELCLRFDHFAAHQRRIMALKEEGGYLTPVVELRPTLSAQVELLRRAQDELRRLMDDLHEAVHRLEPDDNLLIRDCCTRLQVFLGHVQRHDEHENHIVLYTLTQDIGIKD